MFLYVSSHWPPKKKIKNYSYFLSFEFSANSCKIYSLFSFFFYNFNLVTLHYIFELIEIMTNKLNIRIRISDYWNFYVRSSSWLVQKRVSLRFIIKLCTLSRITKQKRKKNYRSKDNSLFLFHSFHNHIRSMIYCRKAEIKNVIAKQKNKKKCILWKTR